MNKARKVARKCGQGSQSYSQFLKIQTTKEICVPVFRPKQSLTPRLVRKMTLKKIVSFGFRHEGGGPNVIPGVVVVDVRKMFRNPFHDKRLRHRRGTDPEVQTDIRQTPDFLKKVEFLRECITTPGTEIAYIGCTGGHHRSVYLAELLGKELGVPVEHRDIAKA